MLKVKDRLLRLNKFNPKLIGTDIIDCIPQTGLCPNKCQDCYYNHPGFYRPKDIPLLPSLKEVGNKLVRINSGNDSNNKKKLVIESTKQYPKKFYNTSIPDFDFPAPVVFTCNGRDTDISALIVVKNLGNVMMVRFRTDMWNTNLLDEVIMYYVWGHHVPITITFMRYFHLDSIPSKFREYYEFSLSILNEYYMLKREFKKDILDRYSGYGKMVDMCGTLDSNACMSCKRCQWAYERLVNSEKWKEFLE